MDGGFIRTFCYDWKCVALDCRVRVCAEVSNLIALFPRPFLRHRDRYCCMLDNSDPPSRDRRYLREANHRHRNGLAVLLNPDLSTSEGFPVAEILNAVCDGFGYCADAQELGLHAVDLEAWWDGVVGGGDALGHE